ncbi:hypothetical protein EVAR_102003_1 [Eumeta japonica]|uniref:Uncharacterized protein n=1 Tax=Eumeta variegata TaxID=151549 RepID=A0A4C1SNS9_EUMVA|nr:hypothetical protein EVAR_102003_1 [Eumeta japonica]
MGRVAGNGRDVPWADSITRGIKHIGPPRAPAASARPARGYISAMCAHQIRQLITHTSVAVGRKTEQNEQRPLQRNSVEMSAFYTEKIGISQWSRNGTRKKLQRRRSARVDALFKINTFLAGFRTSVNLDEIRSFGKAILTLLPYKMSLRVNKVAEPVSASPPRPAPPRPAPTAGRDCELRAVFYRGADAAVVALTAGDICAAGNCLQSYPQLPPG